MSAITVGEIKERTDITSKQDEAKAEELEAWLCKVLASYSVLPIVEAAFRDWALHMHRKSETMIEEALVAETATMHRLTVVNPKVNNFRQFGVNLQKPLEAKYDEHGSAGPV